MTYAGIEALFGNRSPLLCFPTSEYQVSKIDSFREAFVLHSTSIYRHHNHSHSNDMPSPTQTPGSDPVSIIALSVAAIAVAYFSTRSRDGKNSNSRRRCRDDSADGPSIYGFGPSLYGFGSREESDMVFYSVPLKFGDPSHEIIGHAPHCSDSSPVDDSDGDGPPSCDCASSVSSSASEDEPALPPDLQPPRRTSSISFDDAVCVVPIPKFDEYPVKVRRLLWGSTGEIYENAVRNSVEFASEGWDWRTVATDEAMYLCRASGELIHPVHLEPHGPKSF